MDDKELVGLLENLMHTMEEHERSCLERLTASGLTVAQVHYLDEIYHLGQPTVSELARHMSVSRPTTTIMVKQLAHTGYLVKQQSDEDRRSFRIHLTDEGRSVAQVHAGIHREFAAGMVGLLNDDDKSAFITALRRLTKG